MIAGELGLLDSTTVTALLNPLVLASVLVQRAGVTGFTVLTEPFGQRVKDITAFQETDRPLPTIVLTHPMQNITEAEPDQRAAELADATGRLLAGPRRGARAPIGPAEVCPRASSSARS
ncbi:hypothetical protein [Actinomadura rugatobispora]|uniref:Uncharacterized protein n=1 Tax=Actinomadura rugatobispora TaxID=1994 RepID=A0ABW1AAK3_9ACTN|nr:hypothetical protein GCM10010200_081910 [Actinomadura rugatobispora]